MLRKLVDFFEAYLDERELNWEQAMEDWNAANPSEAALDRVALKKILRRAKSSHHSSLEQLTSQDGLQALSRTPLRGPQVDQRLHHARSKTPAQVCTAAKES